MAWVDLVLLGMLAASVLLGLWRGLVYELLSILGWVAAYLGAPLAAPWIVPWLPQERLGEPLSQALALVIGFVAILVVWGLAARLLQFLIHATPLNLIDRLLGGGFGVLRGLLLCLLATVLVSMTPAVRSAPWQQSQLAPWLDASLQWISPALPEVVAKYIRV